MQIDPVTGAAGHGAMRRLRGTSLGTLAALGALLAHLLAGGEVETVPGLVVLAIALPVGSLMVTPGRVAPARVLALAIGAQAVGHLTLSMAPGGHAHAQAHSHAEQGAEASSLGGMLLGHALVAATIAALACGLDRALINLLGGLLARLLPLRAARPVVPAMRRLLSAHSAPVRRLAGVVAVAPTRGPPFPAAPQPHPASR